MRNKETGKERIERQFWIDCQGKEYKFTGKAEEAASLTSLHAEIANLLLPNIPRPQDTLMRKGWIMVGSTVYARPLIYSQPTQAQINALDRIGLLEELLIECEGKYIPWKNLSMKP